MVVKIVTDGGYRMSQGIGAWAFLILVDDKIVKRDCGVVINSTSNQCEYIAVLKGIRACYGMISNKFEVVSDSQLVVNQIANGWKVNNQKLQRLNAMVIAERFKVFGDRDVVFRWNPRDSEFTILCDQMCDEAIDKAVVIKCELGCDR